MEDTRWSRDLPVLDAAVDLFQSEDFADVGDSSIASLISYSRCNYNLLQKFS
jgi:hypothetical protein